MDHGLASSFFAELPTWLRGIFLGIALSAPVGPIGLICIRRTLDRGLLLGLATGLGAACADTVSASVAAFGLSAVIDFLMAYSHQLRIAGAVILLFIGYKIWTDRSTDNATIQRHETHEIPSATQLLQTATGGFAITFTNPVTVFAVLTLVTTLGLSGDTPGDRPGKFEALLLVLGVWIGSCIWWAALCGFASLFRRRISGRTITNINRGTALVLSLFAIWILGYAVGRLLPQPLLTYL